MRAIWYVLTMRAGAGGIASFSRLSPLFLLIMGICIIRGTLRHMSSLPQFLDYTGSSTTQSLSVNITTSDLWLPVKVKQAGGMEFYLDRDQQTWNLLPLEKDEQRRDPRPTQLRLVMIGDSVTRYQYLSLAYFLKTSTWYNSSTEGPDIFSHQGLTNISWNDLNKYTNQLLSPNERCDCDRPPKMIRKTRQHLAKYVSNRYFMDDERDNMLVYLQAYGHMSPMQGRVPATNAMENISSFHFDDLPTKIEDMPTTSIWQYDDWDVCVREYIAKLDPKPTHVIFNAGIWNHNFNIPEYGRRMAAALNESGIVGIWKTTTYQGGGKVLVIGGGPRSNESETLMSKIFYPRVLDSSWTSKIKSQFYKDSFHFLEPVYRAQNEDMLELMGHTFPSHYEKINKSKISDKNRTSSSAHLRNSKNIWVMPSEMTEANGMEFNLGRSQRHQQAGTMPLPEKEAHKGNTRPSQLRLVMIGDSVTHDQYLSLAYFLKTSTWYNSSTEGPDIFSHQGLTNISWNDLNKYTNQLLSPNERCDCDRPPKMIRKTRQHLAKYVSNRYFMDDERDNMLVYLQAYGHMSPMQGRVPATNAMENISSFHFDDLPTKIEDMPTTSIWQYDDWDVCVREYIAKLDPKPTHVIFNAGIWNHNFNIPEYGRRMAAALNESGIVGIWKTTTYQGGGKVLVIGGGPRSNESETLMSKIFYPRVLDSSWTSKIKSQFYKDSFHFLEPVYRAQNEDMLELMGHTFPSHYEKVKKAELMSM